MRVNRSIIIVSTLAIAIATASAKNYAGSWNDSSRFATVESLVDRHTWSIDESIFVKPPAGTFQPHPFGPIAQQFPGGTQDKLWIDGHFYSDKSPVPAVFMAASYQVWQWCGGPRVAQRPDLFCWFMSLLWAGGAFVLAVVGIDCLAQNAHLPERFRYLIAASFAVGTIALPYARFVNNHLLLLAISTWLIVFIDRPATSLNSLLVGTLAGLAYTIDLGAGPVICLFTGIAIAFKSWSIKDALIVGAAALPWLFLHHSLNFMIGGTLGPANANPAFFRWPGCPFNETNLTGGWPHKSIWAFCIYALDMLVGKKGLMTHNPQLWLAVVALCILVKQRSARLPMVVLTASWFVGVWLLYSASSRNQSGVCVSIRWFVPLLAPAYYWLIQALKFRPEAWKDLATLSGGGWVINLLNWYQGPWSGQISPILWLSVAIAGVACGWLHRVGSEKANQNPESFRRAA